MTRSEKIEVNCQMDGDDTLRFYKKDGDIFAELTEDWEQTMIVLSKKDTLRLGEHLIRMAQGD